MHPLNSKAYNFVFIDIDLVRQDLVKVSSVNGTTGHVPFCIINQEALS